MKAGLDLADARRRLGFSLEDVSRATKISVEGLSAIERGDRQHLPPLVYLRGFLRAYAAEVDLDGDDVTHRYLAELELMPDVDPSVAMPAAESDPVRELPTAESPLGEFASEESLAAEPADSVFQPESVFQLESAPRRQAPPQTVLATEFGTLLEPAPPRESTGVLADELDVIDPDRVVAPVAPAPSVPSITPRPHYGGAMLTLLVAAAVVAGFLFAANVDRITQRPAESSDNHAATASTDGHANDDRDTVAAPVSPSAEPPLTPDREGNPSHASASETGAADPDDRRVAAERATQVDTATERTELAKRQAERNVNTASDGEPQNLSGWWTLSNRVESASYAAFNELNLGYRVRLQQHGNRVTGTGHKWMENGKRLPAKRRTPIALEGTRNGQRLELTFTERGARRVSRGTFVMEVTADGALQGRFLSDAANSQGSSFARRATPPPE